MDKLDVALGIENVVLSMSADDGEVKSARRAVRRLLQEYSGIEIDNKKTLVDTISDITLNGKKDTLRTVSLMVLRLLSIPEFFPKNTSENKLESKIILISDEAQPFSTRPPGDCRLSPRPEASVAAWP